MTINDALSRSQNERVPFKRVSSFRWQNCMQSRSAAKAFLFKNFLGHGWHASRVGSHLFFRNFSSPFPAIPSSRQQKIQIRILKECVIGGVGRRRVFTSFSLTNVVRNGRAVVVKSQAMYEYLNEHFYDYLPLPPSSTATFTFSFST